MPDTIKQEFEVGDSKIVIEIDLYFKTVRVTGANRVNAVFPFHVLPPSMSDNLTMVVWDKQVNDSNDAISVSAFKDVDKSIRIHTRRSKFNWRRWSGPQLVIGFWNHCNKIVAQAVQAGEQTHNAPELCSVPIIPEPVVEPAPEAN